MSTPFRVDNPATGELAFEVPTLAESDLEGVLERADRAQKSWQRVPISARIEAVERFIEEFKRHGDAIAREITLQMGKPLAQAAGEIGGVVQRSRHMCSIAEAMLAPETLDGGDGITRRITRVPAGIGLDSAAWNYPLLVAGNAGVPAGLVGNAVLIQHSPRTPLCADRLADAFQAAGVPDGLVQALHVDHATCAKVIRDPRIGAISFTGSVRGGREVLREAARHRFIDVGLELGGKDPAYVAEDADLDFAIANVSEGALYNAGQSCCAVERVYVHRSLHDRFVEGAMAAIADWTPGDPLAEGTPLGPMALPEAPDFLASQVADARSRGASVLTGGDSLSGPGRFFAPTLLTGVDHSMRVMTEETFGPMVGIMAVDSDEEAVRWMNDSPFGLTASLWTRDPERALRLGDQLVTGTVFQNRCDVLDPSLPWAGAKDSGRGATLSRHGFDTFTRFKSFHLRERS